VEPASKAPKNLGESKANTKNPMAVCAPERNGTQSSNKRPLVCFSSQHENFLLLLPRQKLLLLLLLLLRVFYLLLLLLLLLASK
jgi:hypothetical protein